MLDEFRPVHIDNFLLSFVWYSQNFERISFDEILSLRRDFSQKDSFWRDSFRRASILRDSFWKDSIQWDSFRRDSFWRDSIWRDSFRRDSLQRDSFWRDSFIGDCFRRDSFQRDSFCRDSFQRYSVQRDFFCRDVNLSSVVCLFYFRLLLLYCCQKIHCHGSFPPSLFLCVFVGKLFIDPCLWKYQRTKSFSKRTIVPFQAVAMKGKISSDDALLQMRLCSSDNT